MRNQRVDISVTLTQLSALGVLAAQGPLSAGELATAERVQPPSMTKVISSLELGGLVVRKASPSDRRQAIIAITDKGLALLDSERRSRDAWLTNHLSELTAEERKVLRAAIPVLQKMAEQ